MRLSAWLLLLGLLVMPWQVWAQEAQTSCEQDLAFWKRHSSIVVNERDRALQRQMQMELERAYFKQRIAQLEKASKEPEK